MKPVQMIALAAVVACSPATAQEAAPDAAQTAPDTAPCELHVWPADAAKTFSTLMEVRWTDMATVEKYSRDPRSPLGGTAASVDLQRRVFGALDLPALLSLPGFAVVLHDQPLESRVIRTTKGRILSGSPPCYAELVTDDVFFQENHLLKVDNINNSQLNTTFRFRRFDAGETATFSYGSFVTRDLFDPRKRPEPTLANAIAQFETAFAESITQFARAMQAAAQAKSKGKKSK
ncbi:MAG: hypothetical protein O9293_12005 [Porphyrobacter sp.]|nr:hypothetical protein [Porphyrobacter sp.]